MSLKITVVWGMKVPIPSQREEFPCLRLLETPFVQVSRISRTSSRRRAH
ncbi:hypothetical protein ACIOHS_40975 [Streptomyces sp. NPDC088253]